MTREAVIQAVRAWLITAATIDPDEPVSVIPADDPGPRPALPYAVVAVRGVSSVGEPERREHADGYVMHGLRRVRVEITACGSAAADWLLDLDLAPRDDLDAAGLAVEAVGDVLTVPGIRDTEIEDRAVVEVVLLTGVARSPVVEVEFATAGIEITIERRPDAPDPLVVEWETGG